MKRKNLFKAIPLSIAGWLAIGFIALAAFAATITVINTGSAIDMLGANVSTNARFMADNGYFDQAEGLDTRVLLGTQERPHLLADDRIMFAAPIGGNSTQTLQFTTGSSVNLTNFNVITGVGGNFTTIDASNLEPSNNATITFSDTWIDTSRGNRKFLVSKDRAMDVFVSANTSGNITAVTYNQTASTVIIRPDGAGFITQLTANPVVPNWQNVDDTTPDDAATVVRDSTGSSFTDLYELGSTNRSTGYITQIEVTIRIFDGDGNGLARPVIRTGGTTYNGSAVTIPNAWTNFSETFVTNNATGGRWTWEEIEVLQAGVVLNSGGGAVGDCTQVFVTVSFLDTDLEVTASGVATAEHDLTVDIGGDRPDFDDWATNAAVSVPFGAGLLPVMILDEVEYTSANASHTFTGIDTLVSKWDTMAGVTSRHLVVVASTSSPDVTTDRNFLLRFNNDIGANYNYQTLDGTAAAASAARTTGTTSALAFEIPGTSLAANAVGGGAIVIPHAFNTANHKAYIAYGGASEQSVQAVAGRWADTSAITDVTVFLSSGNFDSDTVIQIGVIHEGYLVEEATPNSANVTFAGIPGTGNDLVVIGYPRTDRASTADDINRYYNGDTTAANYNVQVLQGAGAATSASTGADDIVGRAPGNTATANTFGAFLHFISAYAEAANDPHALTMSGFHETGGGDGAVRVTSSRRNNVVAITQVDFGPGIGTSFENGSLFSLYRVPRTVIARVELSGPADNVTISGIPQTFEVAQASYYARSNSAAASDNLNIIINSDNTTASYDNQEMEGAGAVVTAARSAASQLIGEIPAATEGANQYGSGVVNFPQYSEPDRHKHFFNINGNNEDRVAISSNRYESNSPVTSITFWLGSGNSFAAGTIFELVGLMPSRTMSITVDGTVEAIGPSANLSVVDSTNNIDWLTGNTISYADNISMSVNGTQVLLYAPTDYIVGITLPDRSGFSNTGNFTFGANPVTVSMGILESTDTTTAVTGLETPDVLPDVTQPVPVIDAARLACLTANDPILYPIFNAINTATGTTGNAIPILPMYWMLFLMLSLIAFGTIYKFTSHLPAASIGLGTVVGFATAWPIGCGVYDWPVLLIVVLLLAGLNVMAGRQPA